MGRPRTKPLPRGVYERKLARGRVVYWIDFRDANGERVQEYGGATIAEAGRLLEQRRDEVARGTFTRATGSSEQTIATYAERWIELRRREGVRTVEREHAMLRDHVLPTLGGVRLAELRPRDVAELVRHLVAASGLAPKSIRNVHSVLSAMLSRARFDELIADNPAKGLPKGFLPKNVRRREVSPWTRDEIERLITPHDDVPEDFTLAYAIASYTGARVGEIAGLRWRDIDTAARPLWRWMLRTQYDGQPLKTARNTSESPRDVPIHPELQRMLAAWKLEGWPRLMLRAPRPDDFVLPRPPHRAGRRPHFRDLPHHTSSSLGARVVRRHAKKLGIDPARRDFHSFRRSMITLCRTDGARADVLERVTHNAAGEQIDGYTYFGWEPLCEAVSCLRVAPRAGVVIELRRPRAVGSGDASGDAPPADAENTHETGSFLMESRGIEPLTSSMPSRRSPS